MLFTHKGSIKANKRKKLTTLFTLVIISFHLGEEILSPRSRSIITLVKGVEDFVFLLMKYIPFIHLKYVVDDSICICLEIRLCNLPFSCLVILNS
jgi:hypothetical protein